MYKDISFRCSLHVPLFLYQISNYKIIVLYEQSSIQKVLAQDVNRVSSLLVISGCQVGLNIIRFLCKLNYLIV